MTRKPARRILAAVPILVLASRKGGAGKTTLAVGLASAFARRRRTVLVDADPQGSAAAWLPDAPALPVVHAPEPLELARRLGRIGRDTLAVVDLPPHDPEPTAAAVRLADLVLVPLVPSVLDLRAVEPLLEALGDRALVVLSQVIARANVTEDLRKVLGEMGARVARVEIGRRVAHVEAALAHQSVMDYAPASRAAAEVAALAREAARSLEGR